MLSDIKKIPINELSLENCYSLNRYGYTITKSNDKVIVVKKG